MVVYLGGYYGMVTNATSFKSIVILLGTLVIKYFTYVTLKKFKLINF